MIKTSLTKISILASLLLVVSCGGSDNKTTNAGVGSTYLSPQLVAAGVGTLAADLQSSLKCESGKRLTRPQIYNVRSQNNDATRIYGQFQQGEMPGTAGQKYVGVSLYNDYMIVTEVINGSSVVGHNVYISMCSQYINNYGVQLPLIADERPISGFQAPSGMVLDKDNFCPHGVIDAAFNTYMVAGAYQYNVNGMSGTLNPYEIYTTFFKPTCNGQF